MWRQLFIAAAVTGYAKVHMQFIALLRVVIFKRAGLMKLIRSYFFEREIRAKKGAIIAPFFI